MVYGDVVVGANTGCEMYRLIEDLYPFCRSITGNGVRQTLDVLHGHIPLQVHEVPSGERVYDWTVPQEWNIRDAYVIGPKGDKIIDFRKSNLHVLNYSVPLRKKLSLEELKQHLYTLPEHPDWIPYRTSYYVRNWGFCMSHNQYMALEDGEYSVVIDASLEDGFLTYGEYLLPGQSEDEVLISCHICHPSMCNDNLSGMALATFLAKELATRKLRYSYRFLFIPGTIGAITWLARNRERHDRIKHGLVVTGVGDSGPFIYKKSRRGNAELDQVVAYVLENSGKEHRIIDFIPYGYDERQYCSPGLNLPVGRLTRSTLGCYPQYHTSADDLQFVRPDCLGESMSTYLDVVDILENNKCYINRNPKCEPQLGKRNLYNQTGGDARRNKDFEMAMLWVLNYSDGEHSLLDIAKRSGLPFGIVTQAAEALCHCDLLRAV